MVLEAIKDTTDLANENPQEFYEIAMQDGRDEALKVKKESELKRDKVEMRINELDNIIQCLFEERAAGRMTPERYDKLAAGYETEQRELEAELAELSKKVETMNLQETCINEFMDKAKTNIGMNDVTPKLLNLFVTRIEVSERESRNSGCAIKIRYTFQPECL